MTHGMLNQLVAFTLNGQAYALSLARVRQVLRAVEVTPLPQAPDIVLGVVSLHGTVVPVFSMRRRLGLVEGGTNLSDHLIVADTEGRSVALLVDAVNGVVERSTEEITVVESIVPGADYVEGIAKLENGMLFIHNLDRFLSQPEQNQLHDALSKARGAE
jgi:purine-binding chemotaxis protein CheW